MSFFWNTYKKILANSAKIFYGNPAKEFFLIAITGSIGKTTTGLFLFTILQSLVWPTAFIAKDFLFIWNEKIPIEGKITAFSLQKLLAQARASGCQIAILTIDIHDIEEKLLESIELDMAILTNISADETKDASSPGETEVTSFKKVFLHILANTKPNKLAVFPKDDKFWQARYTDMWFDKAINFWIISSASLQAENINLWPGSTTFSTVYLWQPYLTKIPLPGRSTIYDALAAIGAGALIGLEINQMIQTIVTLPLAAVDTNNQVVYDAVFRSLVSAGNTDAISQSFSYCHEVTKGRVICVISGNELINERSRKEIGKIADKFSSIIIVTGRYETKENRLSIVQHICSWTTRSEGNGLFIIAERKFALQFAKTIANPNDSVIILTDTSEIEQDKSLLEKILEGSEKK